MKTVLTREKQEKGSAELKKELGISNIMAVPRLTKVVVSVGTGSMKDKKRGELVADRLSKITGQKASPRSARKAIAGFKSREGDVIGYTVTLRGARMFGFLDKLLNVAIPRTRDFRGLETRIIDDMGNLTMGIKENTIFPETAEEDLRDVFGLAITIGTTAKNKKDALAFFKTIGIPFKK